MSFLPTVLGEGRGGCDANASDAPAFDAENRTVVCMDVRPVPGQAGLSCGVDTNIGAKEENDDRIAAADILELGFFCGVFDGHRGSKCAEFISEMMPSAVLAEYRKRVKRERKGLAKLSMRDEVALISNSIVDAFEATDQAFLQHARKKGLSDGSTAVVALVAHGFEAMDVEGAASAPSSRGARGRGRRDSGERAPGTVAAAPRGVAKLFVAWCGDSRAILVRGRQGVRCSEDHKPTRTDEQQRVQRAGGRVMTDAWGTWRVGPRDDNACVKELQKPQKKDVTAGKWFLSTSRAFGDPELKAPDPIVISNPDVKVIDLVPEDWAIVLGCDGIFDYMSDQQVADVVWKSMVEENLDVIATAKTIVSAALRAGSKDNLTTMVMRLGWTAPSDVQNLVGASASRGRGGAAPDEFSMFG